MARASQSSTCGVINTGVVLGWLFGSAVSFQAGADVVEGVTGTGAQEVSIRYRCDGLDCDFEAVLDERMRTDAIEYEWRLEDGNTVTAAGSKFAHSWSVAGSQLVSLSVTDRYCDLYVAEASLQISASESTSDDSDSLSRASVRLGQEATRSMSEPLEGTTVSGDAYIFVEALPRTGTVEFRLSGPELDTRTLRVERNAPYDLAGGSVDLARPFDTRDLTDGIHRLDVVASYENGSTESVSVDFDVRNNASDPVEEKPSGDDSGDLVDSNRTDGELVFSTRSNRVNSQRLAGAELRGNVYLHLAGVEDASSVRFFLDDPSLDGQPRKVEWHHPWDLMGGTPKRAVPFDTQELDNGQHFLSAEIVVSGKTHVVHASFTVAN